MTQLDKLITQYVNYINEWSVNSKIKIGLDGIFAECISKMNGESSMFLSEASDHLEYIIDFPNISQHAYISIRLNELHNPYRSEELYDLEKENATQFDNVALEKLYPINSLDKKELKDVILSVRVGLNSLNTDYYNVDSAKNIYTIKQLEYLNRSLLSKDLLLVYDAFNNSKISLDMSDAEINNIMFTITNKDKFLTTEVRDIFIF